MASTVCRRGIGRTVLDYTKQHTAFHDVGRFSRRFLLTTCRHARVTRLPKPRPVCCVCVRHKSEDRDLNSLFQPVPMMPIGKDGQEVHDIGTELVGALDKGIQRHLSS